MQAIRATRRQPGNLAFMARIERRIAARGNYNVTGIFAPFGTFVRGH